MRTLLIFTAFFLNILSAEKPNILWLTTEDHGPHLGCYGDQFAHTPHLDAFAQKSLRYLHASSNSPVCAPARTTIITGVYPTSFCAQHMRCEVPLPTHIKPYPHYLKKAGYYCTNNHKTGYNLAIHNRKMWDQCNGKAHYKNRPDGKPFFAVFNTTITHESRLRDENPQPFHDPKKVPLPPYHPDTPEVRKDWAQYYDRLTQMDQWFAQHLAELDKAGLSENTIVFFYSDHGSGMPRSKRYIGHSGTHVPLLIHIPEKFAHLRPADYQPGGISKRLVSFVDLAPTLLSLIGEKPQDWHHGSAFLGKQIGKAPDYHFNFRDRMDERYDLSRAVSDGRYTYIKNFMPYVPTLKGLQYQMQTPTSRIWKELYQAGKLNPIQAAAWSTPRPTEELYDLINDPHETINIAVKKPELTKKFRIALENHMSQIKDTGLYAESQFSALMNGEKPETKFFAAKLNPTQLRERLTSEKQPWKKIILIEHLIRARHHQPADLDYLIELGDPSVQGIVISLEALNALTHAPSLNPTQIDALKNLNTTPPADASEIMIRYTKRLKTTLLSKHLP